MYERDWTQSLTDYNWEQQAVVLEDYYRLQEGFAGRNDGWLQLPEQEIQNRLLEFETIVGPFGLGNTQNAWLSGCSCQASGEITTYPSSVNTNIFSNVYQK